MVNAAMDIIAKYNAAGLVDKHIYLNQPAVWQFIETGQKALVEPFIANFQKFNSNSGWRDQGEDWPEVMQSLSHYSYHITGGSKVLCDLQGGVYSDGVVLTDPVVMSGSGGVYGPTDLGGDGIRSFFARHVCGKFYKKE